MFELNARVNGAILQANYIFEKMDLNQNEIILVCTKIISLTCQEKPLLTQKPTFKENKFEEIEKNIKFKVIGKEPVAGVCGYCETQGLVFITTSKPICVSCYNHKKYLSQPPQAEQKTIIKTKDLNLDFRPIGEDG